MRWTLAFLRAASIGFQFLGGYGFIEVRWLEARVMLGGHPVDPFFIEAGSIFLIVFGLVALLGLCWSSISKWQWVSNAITSNSRAFGDLYKEIVERRDELASIADEAPSAGKAIIYIGRLVELEARLSELGIKTPTPLPRIDDVSSNRPVIINWCMFLMMMARTREPIN